MILEEVVFRIELFNLNLTPIQFVIFIFCSVMLLCMFVYSFRFLKEKWKQNQKRKKMAPTNLKEAPYFRDIPFDNIDEAFWVGNALGIVENATDFIGAMILKWIQEDKIDIIEVEGRPALDLNKVFKTNIGFETDIYVLLLGAAGPDRILQEQEIKHLFKWQSKDIVTIFHRLEEKIQRELLEKELITRTFDMYGTPQYHLTEKLKEKAIQLNGLKRFLLDFSLLNEKEVLAVHLWEDYLVYAQLLGISDKVSDTFKELYPGFNETIQNFYMKNMLVTSLKISLQVTASVFTGIHLSDTERRL